MDDDHDDVRLAVYRSFASTGSAPTTSQVAAATGLAEADVGPALTALADARHLVLDDLGGIVLAHPFAAIPMGFSVMGRRTLWWGGCSWDSFAIPHLLPDEPDVLVATRCPTCRTPHAWVVGREAPPHGAHVARFEVPVAHMWDDVVDTCSRQRIYCGPACVEALEGGDVIDLPTLWRLAAGWYEGRLDPGYRRREPAEAAAYFRDAGLTGSFWGLGTP